jgi:hypothetical protein
MKLRKMFFRVRTAVFEENLMKMRTWVTALAISAGAASFGFAGEITGKVTLDGKAPEMKDIDMSGVPACASQHTDPVQEQSVVVDDKGDLANVVVSIKKEDSPDLAGEPSKEPAVLDQKGCMYEPHVLAMAIGQEWKVKNSDPFMHNIHTLPEKNTSFNFGQPTKDDGKSVPEQPKVAEIFHVKCDVHPWMSAYIAVFDHPFFAVTGADGTYTIKNVPDGDYTLQFWQEKYATTPIEMKVSVKNGKATADQKIKAEAAMAPVDGKVKLASDKSMSMPCCKIEAVSKVASAK